MHAATHSNSPLEVHFLSEKRKYWADGNVVAALGPMVGVAIIATLEWPHAPHAGIVMWVAIIMSILIAQAALPWALQGLDDRTAMRLLPGYAGLAGFGWGLLVMLVRPKEFAFEAFEVLFVCIIGTGACVFNSAHRPFLFAFELASMGTAAAVYAFRDGAFSQGIALGLCVLTATFIGFGLTFHRSYVRAIELGFENTRLVNELTAKSMALEQTNAAKTRFLASASHDLRQPLHAISLLAGLLAEQRPSEGQRDIIERINNSAEAMESLLNGILDLSRLDAGSDHPRLASIDVLSILDRIERTFMPTATARRLSFRLRPLKRWVVSDATMLMRMLDNLVGNALRYTRSGGVLVAVRPRGPEHVAFEVWDTGVGIPADKLDDIFAEFVQLQNPARDRSLGLGLGLSIVRRTAQLLGHGVEVESRVGRGTVFRLIVPTVPEPEFIGAPGIEATAEDVDPDGLVVLVVDDEEPIRHAMAGLLESWGCVARTAEDGDAALAQFPASSAAPDALLCDYRFAVGNGLDIVERLRAKWGRDVPALVVTGDVSAAQLRDIAASGLQVMHKPVNPARLRAWLASLPR
jgi:signal transduction histidine kinase/CheY-like chemotaxis protein